MPISHKTLGTDSLLKVVRLTEEGEKQAKRSEEISDLPRREFRHVGFVGRVTAIYEDRVFLGSTSTTKSIFHPSSVFAYDEVERLHRHDARRHRQRKFKSLKSKKKATITEVETSVTKWLSK